MQEHDELCMHPYRKRKFFYELAALLDEEPPVIQRLADAFPATKQQSEQQAFVTAKHDGAQDGTQDGAHATETSAIASQRARAMEGSGCVASDASASLQDPDEESFDFVEFERTSLDSVGSSFPPRHGRTSQGSMPDSMQDSFHFLPPVRGSTPSSLSVPNGGGAPTHDRSGGPLQVTTLVSDGVVPPPGDVELQDYYDADRYCELAPCWLYPDEARCRLHKEPIRCPGLLFCLQALDEIIACKSAAIDRSWFIEACKLARTIFASMWEADVLNPSSANDIVIANYVAQKATVPGVSLDVWRAIDTYWTRHRQNYLHQQELFFVDKKARLPSHTLEWYRTRPFLHVFGAKPHDAARLSRERTDEQCCFRCACNVDLALEDADKYVHPFPSTHPIRIGVEYLKRVPSQRGECGKQHARRDLVTQNEWKVAFRAIEIHLRAWCRDVQVFPCGSFSRGAAFGSVIDVLVSLPEGKANKGNNDDYQETHIDRVLAALVTARIVDLGQVQKLSASRAIAIVPFKTLRVLVDLKVYARPKSWLALLFYTGPECYSREMFSLLLKRPLWELTSPTTFDCVYEEVIKEMGFQAICNVDSEKEVFDLVGRKYIPPPQRF